MEFTKSPYEMIDMNDAFEIVDKAAFNYNRLTTKLDLETWYSHTLSEDIISKVNIPPFRASIMDGYAFRKSEYLTSKTFTLIDNTSFAGSQAKAIEDLHIPENGCMYVTTGSPVNYEFDMVAPIEHVVTADEEGDIIEAISETGKTVRFLRQEVGQNWIREVGWDVKNGSVVLEKGTKIGASEIGILASVGCATDIQVYKKPRVGIAASGNEIVEFGDQTIVEGDGKIRDSNTPMMTSILRSHGFDDIFTIGICKDDYESIDKMFKELTETWDLIITTGGVSMGAKDLIKPYIAEHGEILFGRLNMKPGKPTTFGRLYDKLVFSLPGNPVSCFVTAQLFITRALKIMSGTQNYELAIVNVDIPKPLKLDSNRPEYHRVIIYTEEGKENYQCISTGNQQSSRLLSTVTANAFLILPDAITFGKQLYDDSQAKAVVFGEVNHKRK